MNQSVRKLGPAERATARKIVERAIAGPGSGGEAAHDVMMAFKTLVALKAVGEDFEDGPALRSALVEKHGRLLVILIDALLSDLKQEVFEVANKAAGEVVREQRDLLKAVRATCDSPIDDADKVAHIKELIQK